MAIGELSRASGLTVSALRFYDREGVLVPAEVDPDTGYRRYSPAQLHRARLLAGMRRVGMPLAEMGAVLDSLPDVAAAQDLLEAHVRRLEDGLSDARREVSRLTGLLAGPRHMPLELTVDGHALARAIDSVRYAASADPDFPMLCGVLLEPHAAGLRLVATDRYRLAVAEVDGAPTGHPEGSMSVLPTALIDRLRSALWENPQESSIIQSVQLSISPTTFRAGLGGGEEVVGAGLDLDFPDYRRILHAQDRPEASTLRLPVSEILTQLAGSAEQRVRLGGSRTQEAAQSQVTTGAHDRTELSEPTETGLLVDRAFLWEAASTLDDGYAVLPADGEIAPLVLHGADGTLAGLLMPVRPEPA